MSETPGQEQAQQLQDFAEFVPQIMQDWKVQGLAIAIVKEDSVIFSQGFGKRDVAANLPVTPQTLFPIASCTKAFTTASMALLVDEGKLDWDTPVRTYIPSFRLYDPVAAERVTPRDLVTHRTGLPRHDLAWYHSSASRQELFERLQYLEPTRDFRTLWQYQNLMYMAAGYLVEKLAGQSWEDFVQARLFQPLGMDRSNFSIVETARQDSDFSHPYSEENDEVKEIPFYAAQGAVAPAGAIVSCVEDMSKWLLLHLHNGNYNGRQLLSSVQVAQLHAPQMVISEASRYPELPYASYALGWSVSPYRGYPMVQHSGGIDGFSSLTTLFPQQKIGMVVLSNMGGTPAPSILTFQAFERLLGLDEAPWNARSKEEQAEYKKAEQQGKEKSETDRIADTHPSHPLTAYAGDYEHPGYGLISIELEGEQLQMSFNNMQGPLKHYHYDIFEATLEQLGMALKISFLTNVSGDIATLVAPLEVTAKDIVFQRVAERRMRERSFLEQFVGVYDLLHMDVTVALKDDATLLVSVPGQPEYVLEPYRDTEFRVKGMSGFSIEFKQNSSGAVTEALIVQPYGAFTVKRKQ